jgi:hypothetical protein
VKVVVQRYFEAVRLLLAIGEIVLQSELDWAADFS